MRISGQMVEAARRVAKENMREISAIEIRQMLQAAVDAAPAHFGLATFAETMQAQTGAPRATEPRKVVAHTPATRDLAAAEGDLAGATQPEVWDQAKADQRLRDIADARVRLFFGGEFTEKIKDAVKDEVSDLLREWVPGLVNAELSEERLRNLDLDARQRLDAIANAVRHTAVLNVACQTGWGQRDMEAVIDILEGRKQL